MNGGGQLWFHMTGGTSTHKPIVTPGFGQGRARRLVAPRHFYVATRVLDDGQWEVVPDEPCLRCGHDRVDPIHITPPAHGAAS